MGGDLLHRPGGFHAEGEAQAGMALVEGGKGGAQGSGVELAVQVDCAGDVEGQPGREEFVQEPEGLLVVGEGMGAIGGGTGCKGGRVAGSAVPAGVAR